MDTLVEGAETLAIDVSFTKENAKRCLAYARPIRVAILLKLTFNNPVRRRNPPGLPPADGIAGHHS